MLKIKTSDNEIFEVEENLAIKSVTLRFMMNDEVVADVIPLPKVNGQIMAKIIERWQEHDDKVGNPTDELKSWEAKFFDMDADILYSLLMAATHLKIHYLIYKVCEKIADVINSKSPTAIRKLYNIPDDFILEGEAKNRENNA